MSEIPLYARGGASHGACDGSMWNLPKLNVLLYMPVPFPRHESFRSFRF